MCVIFGAAFTSIEKGGGLGATGCGIWTGVFVSDYQRIFKKAINYIIFTWFNNLCLVMAFVVCVASAVHLLPI